MSQFEVLNRLSSGQYLPTGSILHKMDPRAKIPGFTALILALTLARHTIGLTAALLLLILILIAGKIPLKHALRSLLAPLPFILLLAVLQVFITPAGQNAQKLFSWHFLSITSTGIQTAFMLVLRFFGLLLLLLAASASTSTLELIYGLDLLFKPLQKLGIRTQSITMVVQIMLRFIPFLAMRTEKIARSQASRGAIWGSRQGNIFQRARQLLPLLIPLFTTSLQQADTLTQAMLARGYGSTVQRTGLREYHFRWKDAGFILLCLAASAAILAF